MKPKNAHRYKNKDVLMLRLSLSSGGAMRFTQSSLNRLNHRLSPVVTTITTAAGAGLVSQLLARRRAWLKSPDKNELKYELKEEEV